MCMYLHQVSGRGHRTQEPLGSTFNALPLSYPQSQAYCRLFKKKKKQKEHKLNLNKDNIFFIKHELKSMCMCLRQISDRGASTS